MKKTIAWFVAVLLLLTLVVPAYAAGVTIDTGKTGSFTIYKYDMTTATGNGINLSSFVALQKPPLHPTLFRGSSSPTSRSPTSAI